MRIGIDAHFAESDGTGNCTYTQNLLRVLTKIDSENEYIMYAINSTHPFYKEFANKPNFKIRRLFPQKSYIRIPLSLSLNTFCDDLDILHVQYISPPLHKGKLILMIHDLAPFHFPECFSRMERTRSKFLFSINAIRASKILTVSEYSKKDIATKFKIYPEKITVTYNGVNSNFRPTENSMIKAEILRKYGISGNFIFSLGRLDPRKNLLRLIKAYTILKKKQELKIKLVIAGKEDYLSQKIKTAINSSGFRDDIILAGYIPEQELPVFLTSAEVFVYPSLFEGFGLPVLEAMACACPVITSKCSSLPEIVGEAGIMVDPYNVDEIAGAIYDVIVNKELQTKLSQKGLKQAKLFSWENAALKTLEVYEEVHRKGRKF